MNDLAAFLGENPPFDALSQQDLSRAAAAAEVVDYASGDHILDAFTAPSAEVFVVVSGQVELWNSEVVGSPPDEVLGRGGVLGFSAMLTRSAAGPLAVALGPARVIRMPADVVEPAFSTAAGVRFLAQNVVSTSNRTSDTRYGIVDQLIISAPVVADPAMTVAEVATLMTERGSRYAALPTPDGFGLVTDASLRERVLAHGLSAQSPAAATMITPAPTVASGTLAAQALLELTDRGLDVLLVTDRTGELRGIVDRQDFVVAPSTIGVSLREQIERTVSPAQLVQLARRAPLMVGDLLRRGRSVGEVCTVYSTVVDAVMRQALMLVLEPRADVDRSRLTWLALGSNGRREPVLSSDLDAAVVFDDAVDSPDLIATYRGAFDEVSALLAQCGLSVDVHGATPGRPLFARTGQQWKSAATGWIDAPLADNGLMMTSLLLDARPIHGDPGLPVVNDIFGEVRRHPGTLRLLLAESLSNRARLRSMRDVLARRGGTFDIKTHALRPVIEIARWAALSVGSTDLSTPARLAAASGSLMLPADQAELLTEVFEVLQRIRLHYQVEQLQRNETPSDVLSMRRLSPLDRSLIAQAVREVSTNQKRMWNLSQIAAPESW